MRQGVPVVAVDDDDARPTGSRAIRFAKRTLEVRDLLGCGDRIAERGASGNVPLRCLVVAPSGFSPTLPRDATMVDDVEGPIAARYDAAPGSACRIRADPHVCARWCAMTPDGVCDALDRARCRVEVAA